MTWVAGGSSCTVLGSLFTAAQDRLRLCYGDNVVFNDRK